MFTDISFLQVSTLTFELHQTKNITIYSKGYVDHTGQNHSGNENIVNAYSTGVPMQRVRIQINFPGYQIMKDSQIKTYRNRNGKAAKYDMISLYSLLPIEFIGVFSNPIYYYSYWFIYNNTLNKITY